MITVIVSAIILVVVLLLIVWLLSSAFRAWTEKPKYTMLERNEMFERAANNEFNDNNGFGRIKSIEPDSDAD